MDLDDQVFFGHMGPVKRETETEAKGSTSHGPGSPRQGQGHRQGAKGKGKNKGKGNTPPRQQIRGCVRRRAGGPTTLAPTKGPEVHGAERR